MKFHLGHLLALAATVVAACAAFFSVFGLSQLFAGAGIAVMVMASALELSKLISASFLHKYWDSMSKVLRTYLTVGVIVLAIITSAGIYGFLSNAYQKTANSLSIHEGELKIMDGKISLFTNKINSNDGVMETKTTRIKQLTKLRSVQEVRLDSMINKRYFSNANKTREEIESASSEIKNLNSDIDVLMSENNRLNDSIGKYEVAKLELASTSEVAGEIGPLKYLSELVDKPMDVVVNYFILMLIVVFDPLAISLVIATGWVFEKERLKNVKSNEPKETYTDPITGTIHPGEDLDEYEWEPVKEWDSAEEETPITEEEIPAAKEEETPITEEEIPAAKEDSDVTKEFIELTKSEDIIPSNPPIPRGDFSIEAIQALFSSEPEEVVVEPEDIVVVEPEEVVAEPEEENSEEKPVKQPRKRHARGYSVDVPKPKNQSNSIERVGSNKYMEDGSKGLYKRNR
jgi:hypothetical protein